MRRIAFLGLLPAILSAVPAVAGPSRHTIHHDGEARVYLLDAPSKPAKKKYPVVIALHGGGGNAAGMRKKTRFERFGGGEEFIVVHPQGIAKRTLGKTLATWNAGSCCGLARKKNVDDVGFLSKLIDRLVRTRGADPRRIYVTGHSNGGMMAYRLACEIPSKIAGIAPVGAPVRADTCVAKEPVPILVVHGDSDACGNFAGGRDCGGCFQKFLGIPFKGDNQGPCEPVPVHVANWARARGCEGLPDSVELGPAMRSVYKKCRSPVVFDVVLEHGHGWPGLSRRDATPACRKRPKGFMCRRWIEAVGPYASGYSASERIWEFFREIRPKAK
jgi:polyhydroxybutyrate depolymerase